MAFTSGFYNSVNHDRRYSNTQISMLFDGLISDGVYASIGEAFLVTAGEGMTVNIGTGRAWFNHSWTYNDAEYPVVLDDADVALDRIDAIVLEINSTDSVRLNGPKYIKGEASSSPAEPELVNSDGVYYYPLAFINITANATTISQSDITSMVGTSDCPFVTGIMETIKTDELVAQWRAQFELLFAKLEKQISQAVVGTVIDGSVSSIYRVTIPYDSWHEGDGVYYQSVPLVGIYEADEPIFDVDLSGTETAEEALEIIEANTIYRLITEDDSIQVYATDAIDIDIPIKIRCIRK